MPFLHKVILPLLYLTFHITLTFLNGREIYHQSRSCFYYDPHCSLYAYARLLVMPVYMAQRVAAGLKSARWLRMAVVEYFMHQPQAEAQDGCAEQFDFFGGVFDLQAVGGFAHQ